MDIKKILSWIYNKFRSSLYLLIPLICIAGWALYYLIRISFVFNQKDFLVFYQAGKIIFKDPTNLYTEIERFYYLPNSAIFFAISISLFEFQIASYIFYITNYILSVVILIIFNKILKLMKLEKKIHRFLFLMIISNGWQIYNQFYHNQSKLFVLLCLVVVLNREIRRVEHSENRTFKVNLINLNILIFALGMTPYFIFIIFLYIFQDIKLDELFKRSNIKIYISSLLMFFIQNFLFIIFPNLIFDFLEGFTFALDLSNNSLNILYLREFIQLENLIRYLIVIISIFLLGVFTIFLIKSKSRLEKKFGYFFLFFLLVDTFKAGLLIISIPFIVLIFVPFLDKSTEDFTKFLSKNFIVLIGLFSIVILCFIPPRFTIFKYFPELIEFPFIIFVNLCYIFILCFLTGSLIVLHIKNNNSIF